MSDKERSIRNVPVPPNRRQFIPVQNEHAHRGGGARKGGGSFWLWTVAVIVACVAVGLIVSNFFAGATITVTPRQIHVDTLPALQAIRNAPSGTLSYELMTVSQGASSTVPANGTAQVNTAAQGTLTIYNAYSTVSQKLVTNTRFKAPDGKIYRIHQAVTVPGAKNGAGGVLTPGNIQTTVYADKPGADYNISSFTRFTIPGFAGDPRYSKFYATAEAISGGFSGTAPAVSSADLKNAETAMRQEILNGLPRAIASRLPQGFAAVTGALAVQYGTLSNVSAGNGSALLTQNATATVAIVGSSDAAAAVARIQVPGFGGEEVNFADPSKVLFTLPSGATFSPEATTLLIDISGASTIFWQFDEDKLTHDLAGKNKGDFESIVKTYAPAVAKATASLRPFWRSTFPEDALQINIKISSGN